MPVMNGIDATLELRKQGYKAPIIAFTGHGEDFDENLHNAGMKDIIHKPINFNILQQTMQRVGCRPNEEMSELKIEHRQKLIETNPLAQQFATMITAHLGWKAKIRSFIDGADIGVTYDTAIDHTACVLGKWYYGPEGQKLMHLPLMQKLGEEHVEMHALIRVIMDAFEIDDYETMENAVNNLDNQSDKVVELLNELIDTASEI